MLLLNTVSALLSAVTPDLVAYALRSFSFVLIFAAFGSREWWRYVKHGKPAPWRVEHGGGTALFVTDEPEIV
ncbi:hypothetical protein ACWEOZ_27290 [Actinoplanes sp. NPDC004185]